MKHPEYNFLSMYYWIVCKHALNQKQCGDICILRSHISFLAEMIEFQVLKYSVLWIPHPVNFISSVTFPWTFHREIQYQSKQFEKRRNCAFSLCANLPLKLNTWGFETKSFSNISKFSLNFWNDPISLPPLYQVSFE